MKNKIKNSIIISALSVALMYVVNKFIFSVSVMKDLLKTENGDFYKWRFGDIYYTKQGYGSPLLLIHDLNPLSSSSEWDELVKTLSKTNTVYTIDLLGTGRSSKPNITYTNYIYVQLITDFIKNIIRNRTDVIATGLSSSFTIMACQNNDTLFDKIMFINPEDIIELNKIPSKRSKLLKLLIEAPVIGSTLYNIIYNKKNIEHIYIEKYLFNPFRLQNKHIYTSSEALHLGGGNARYLLSSIAGRYVNFNITQALKNVNNSIFIIGGKETYNIENILDTYVSLNNSIEIAYIENTRYLPQIEAPLELLDYIRVFFYHRVDTY